MIWVSRRAELLGPLAWAFGLAPLGALAILLANATNPALPVAALVGVGLVVLAFLRPLWSLLVGFGLIPLEILPVPVGAFGASPSEMVLLVTAVVWTVSRVAARERPWVRSPMSGPLLLLWLSAVPGVVVAIEPDAVLRILVFWGAFILLFAMIAQEATSRDIRNLLFVFALVAAAVAGFSVATSGGGPQAVSGSLDVLEGRAVGAFGDPNIFGTFLAMALPAGVLLALEGRHLRRSAALAAVALILAGLGISLSRGGIFAAAGALLVMLAWAPLRRVAVFGLILISAAILLNANPLGDVQQVQTVVDRVESVGAQSSSTSDQRPLMYAKTPGMIRDHWLTGVGALNFPDVAPQYGIVDPRNGETFEHPHNVLLTIGAEFGVPGILALLWLVVALVRVVPRVCGRSAGERRGLGLAVLGAIVAIGLQGLVDFTLRSNLIAAATFVMLGAFAALARLADEPTNVQAGAQ